MKATYALLVTGLAAHQAAATWNFFDNFKSPLYNDNECSDKQKGGFNWSDLKDGDSNFQYGDFDFSGGWKCSNSLGKRDALTKRTFGSKAIVNKVRKDKPASFGCDKRKSGFSITEIDVSVEFDVELELHYTMTDGSKCKQYSPCSASGSTIKNTQCGGAKSVDVYLGSHYKGGKSECQIGFHNIGFDCNPGTGYKPPTPPEVPATTPPAETYPASTPPAYPTGGIATPPACEGEGCYAQSTPEATTSSATEPPSPPPATETPIYTPPSDIPYSAMPPYTNASSPAYTPPPTHETSEVPPPSYETPKPESSPVAPPPTQESYTAVPPPPPAASSTHIAPPSTPTYPPASPPDVLPKCMNTWLQIDSKCKDNTDKSCYCVNPDFTKNVIACVSAWCGTDDETRQALQYLIGICAEYVPQNPGIVEDCPTYIPLNPSPPTATPTGGEGASTTPAPTPLVPAGGEAPPAQGDVPCTTITYGTTSLTVPIVHFTTPPPGASGSTPEPTQPVALVPGTAPAETPVTTTPAAGGQQPPYPVPSTLGTGTRTSVPSGTGAVRPSSPAEFTGAAVPGVGGVEWGVLFGAVVAVVAF
ncbi:hypothetical protein IQ07DRAFT_524565 [Pyrenochaeta sp. DS3sAY3a]|nr:hypothetical protein IQ07DRAFT_524565 [Pyrenochaeta sp. DS3sAY3a]